MVKPDKKAKSYVEARCKGRRGEPHIMVLAQLSRGWSCDGGCGTGRRDWAGHDYYTCQPCDEDYCPNCFHKVEKTIVIKKTDVDEDPDEFKPSQTVYSTLHKTYVKVNKADPDAD